MICIYLETLNTVTAELPIVADQAIAREGGLPRDAAERQISALRVSLNGQVTKAAEATEAVDELPGGDPSIDEPSELR